MINISTFKCADPETSIIINILSTALTTEN